MLHQTIVQRVMIHIHNNYKIKLACTHSPAASSSYSTSRQHIVTRNFPCDAASITSYDMDTHGRAACYQTSSVSASCSTISRAECNVWVHYCGTYHLHNNQHLDLTQQDYRCHLRFANYLQHTYINNVQK